MKIRLERQVNQGERAGGDSASPVREPVRMQFRLPQTSESESALSQAPG